jgi:hypothetical protein
MNVPIQRGPIHSHEACGISPQTSCPDCRAALWPDPQPETWEEYDARLLRGEVERRASDLGRHELRERALDIAAVFMAHPEIIEPTILPAVAGGVADICLALQGEKHGG